MQKMQTREIWGFLFIGCKFTFGNVEQGSKRGVLDCLAFKFPFVAVIFLNDIGMI